MNFTKGDIVTVKKDDYYFEQCVSMEYLYSNIKTGDNFLTYRDTYDGKITEFEFLGFTPCEWQGGDGGSGMCKTICKGHLKRKRENDGEILEMCPGYTQNTASCVLKIIKKEYLEDSLFEI